MRKAVAVLVVLIGTACGGDDPPPAPEIQDRPATTSASTSSTTTTPPRVDGHRIEVTVTDGRPDGGVRTEKVDLDARVVLVVITDAPDEIHVHGYGITLDVAPGEPATVAFTADLPGVWEVELHEAGNVILELQVS